MRAAARDAARRRSVGLHDEASDEGIEFDYHRGGTVTLARSALQAERLRHELAELRELGDTEEDSRWLDEREARARCDATARARRDVHAALRRGAPRQARRRARRAPSERRGVEVCERTVVTEIVPATRWRRAAAVTAAGTVRADVVVRATEGYTPRLPGARREVAPLYSLVVATEPLAATFFARVGLTDRETFCDDRHLIIYGQRTADDRLVFGGPRRALPLRLAHRPALRRGPTGLRASSQRRSTSCSARCPAGSPTAGAARSGSRGTSRRSRGSTGRRGVAAAGGYVGDGVVLSHVAGRTLADLIVGRGDRAHVAPLRRAPLTALGARAAAVARDQRGALRRGARGPPRGRDGPRVARRRRSSSA